MTPPADRAEVAFALAQEILAAMSAEPAEREGAETLSLSATAHDVTVFMGLLGPQALTVGLGLDSDSACRLAAALLRHEADTDLDAEPPDERAALMAGAIEELANRIVSRIAARLHEETGVLHDAIPPVTLVGRGADPGGPLQGAATTLRGAWGTCTVLLAVETDGAGGAP